MAALDLSAPRANRRGRRVPKEPGGRTGGRREQAAAARRGWLLIQREAGRARAALGGRRSTHTFALASS